MIGISIKLNEESEEFEDSIGPEHCDLTLLQRRATTSAAVVGEVVQDLLLDNSGRATIRIMRLIDDIEVRRKEAYLFDKQTTLHTE